MVEEFRTANQPNQQRNTTYLHHYDARRWQAGGELKAHINSPLRKTAHTDEAEPNEPDLDIPVEIERRQTRLTAIEAAKTRLEERQMQRDAQRGRTADDDRKPRDQNGKPEAGMHCPRVLAVPASKAHDSSMVPRSRVMKRDRGRFDDSYSAQTVVNEAAHTIVAPPPNSSSSGGARARCWPNRGVHSATRTRRRWQPRSRPRKQSLTTENANGLLSRPRLDQEGSGVYTIKHAG